MKKLFCLLFLSIFGLILLSCDVENGTYESNLSEIPSVTPSEEPSEVPSEEEPSDVPSEEEPSEVPSEEEPSDVPSEEEPSEVPSEESSEEIKDIFASYEINQNVEEDAFFIEEPLTSSYDFDVYMIKPLFSKYLYEVEYNNVSNKYLAGYLKKETAERIYQYFKETIIYDIILPSSLDKVDGYMQYYCNFEEIVWLNFEDVNCIPVNIEEYICIGVYVLRERTVIKELISYQSVNISNRLYFPLLLKDTGEEYLTPIKPKLYEGRLLKFFSIPVEDERGVCGLLDHDPKEFLISDDIITITYCMADISNENTLTISNFHKNRDYSEKLNDFYTKTNEYIYELISSSEVKYYYDPFIEAVIEYLSSPSEVPSEIPSEESVII